MRRGVSALVVAAALAASAQAVAQETIDGAVTAKGSLRGRRVSIAYDTAQSSALLAEGVTRFVAELRVAGFEVELPEAGAEHDASDEPRYAELWLTAHGSRLKIEITADFGGASSHLVILGGEHEVGALAIQSAEFLRAGLVPRVSPPPPPVSAVRPAEPRFSDELRTPTAAALDDLPDSWRVDLGAAVLTNWGAADRLPLLSLRPSYTAGAGVWLGARFDVPLAAARFEASRGSASYRTWLGSASAEYAWLRWGNGEASVGVDAGVAYSTSAGSPDAPLEAHEAELWSLVLGAGASVDYRVLRKVALFADARVLTLSPNPVVAVLDEERRLGAPAALFGVGARFIGQ